MRFETGFRLWSHLGDNQITRSKTSEPWEEQIKLWDEEFICGFDYINAFSLFLQNWNHLRAVFLMGKMFILLFRVSDVLSEKAQNNAVSLYFQVNTYL